MSLPREGSRDISEGIIVSTCPDVCKTPVGAAVVPIPYSIWAKQNDTASGVAESVYQTGKRSHKLGSEITTCHGDEPGTAKGVKSGTVGGVCTPRTYAPNVRIEGKNAIRHGDEWWMNNRNTVGKLIWVRDARTMSDADPEPLGVASDKPTQLAYNDTKGEFTGTQAPDKGTTRAVTRGGLHPGSTQRAPGGKGGLWGLVAKLLADMLITPQESIDHEEALAHIPTLNKEYGFSLDPKNQEDLNDVLQFERELWATDKPLFGKRLFTPEEALERLRKRVEQRIADGDLRAPQRGDLPAEQRISDPADPCKIGNYGDMKSGGKDPCPPGHDAHHVPSDYVFRYGTRNDSSSRMPELPGIDDGLAICLPKHEHNAVHRIADPAVEKLGKEGYAPLGDVLDASLDAVDEVKKHSRAWEECREKLRSEAEKRYQKWRRVPVRTTKPPPGDPRDAYESQAKDD
ncbi:DUF4150 domain-containing protein [Sorangium sp. So ce1335]|uniref:DUF4150 domain-containing protein n=1 Tax=Sorangium sp. So ce1335 TaxID=3133335 RepID=UPI003F5FA429